MIDYLKVNLTLEAQREIMSKRTIDVHKTLVKVGDLPSSVLLKLPLGAHSSSLSTCYLHSNNYLLCNRERRNTPLTSD